MSYHLPCFFTLGVFKAEIHSHWKLPSCDACFKNKSKMFHNISLGSLVFETHLTDQSPILQGVKRWVHPTYICSVGRGRSSEIICEFYKCDNCESNWLSRNTTGTLGWDSPTVLHHLTFFTPVVLQLQLWHLHWLVSVQTVRDLHSQIP